MLSQCSLDRDRVQESASSGDDRSASSRSSDASADAAVEDGEVDAAVVTVAETPARRRLAPGRIAYLRCPGAEVQAAAFPCPRDRDFEQAVWTILEELPRCPLPAPGIGEADLRVIVEPGERTELRLRRRGEDESPGLSAPELLECLRPRMADLQTELRVDELVVSFRFSLVAD